MSKENANPNPPANPAPPHTAEVVANTPPPNPTAPVTERKPEPERNASGKTIKDLETDIAHLQDENRRLKTPPNPAPAKKSMMEKFLAGESID